MWALHPLKCSGGACRPWGSCCEPGVELCVPHRLSGTRMLLVLEETLASQGFPLQPKRSFKMQKRTLRTRLLRKRLLRLGARCLPAVLGSHCPSSGEYSLPLLKGGLTQGPACTPLPGPSQQPSPCQHDAPGLHSYTHSGSRTSESRQPSECGQGALRRLHGAP